MTDWLTPSELRIGLGCMRLEEDAAATIAAEAVRLEAFVRASGHAS